MMTNVLLLPIAVAAFLALSAAMPRHQIALFSRKLSEPESRRARICGWTLLIAMAAAAAAKFGIGRGILVVAGYATIGAGIAVGLQTWRSR
jgi:hypothetical protein